MTSLPQAREFDWTNLGVRVVSGLVLAGAALLAVWVFDWPAPIWRIPFFLLVAGAGALLSMEWAAMAAPRAAVRVAP